MDARTGARSGSTTATSGVGLASVIVSAPTTAACSDVDVDERDAVLRLKGTSLGEISERVCSIELVVLLVINVSCDPSKLAFGSER